MTQKINVADLPDFDMAEHLPDDQAIAEYPRHPPLSCVITLLPFGFEDIAPWDKRCATMHPVSPIPTTWAGLRVSAGS